MPLIDVVDLNEDLVGSNIVLSDILTATGTSDGVSISINYVGYYGISQNTNVTVELVYYSDLWTNNHTETFLLELIYVDPCTIWPGTVALSSFNDVNF